MPKTIISDTSCFILLNNIGEMALLHRLYGEVYTTIEVAVEFGDTLPDWVIISKVANLHYQEILELQIDKGEASAIALAIEMEDATIVLDDYKARKVAEKLGLDITGSLGVIVKAKLRGLITSVKPILAKIKQTNFRLSAAIEDIVIKEAGENQ